MSVRKRLQADDGTPSTAITLDSALAVKKEIAGLLVRNYTSGEIAKSLGISTARVSSYIDAIRQEWNILTSVNFKEFQSQELIKLDQIEREAWLAWERSKGTKRKKRSTYTKSGRSSDVVEYVLSDNNLDISSEVHDEYEEVGESKYLDVVMKSMAHRAKLLGIDKVSVNVFSANISINQEQPEYQQRVDQFLAQFGGDYRRVIDASFDRDGVDESMVAEGEYTITEAGTVFDPDEL